MFSPPKHQIAILAAVTAVFMFADLTSVQAQNNLRTNSLRPAKSRAVKKPVTKATPQPVVEAAYAPVSARPLAGNVPVYQGTEAAGQTNTVAPMPRSTRQVVRPMQAGVPQQNANAMRGMNTRRTQVMQASQVPSSYVPQHLRMTQYVSQESVVEDQAPIMSDGEIVMDGPAYMDSGCGGCGDCLDCCGTSDGYFGAGDACFDRGGCDPCALQNCWIRHLGPLFRNSEWGSGATANKFARFDLDLPGGEKYAVDDNSFGYYFEFNTGIPLCQLTCGLVSWQFGMRSVHTNFDGKPFTKEGRDQTFVTTGFYRRVDYGLQFGCVVDFLDQDWFVKTRLEQVRGDIAWVYPSGKMFGFRFAVNSKTDGDEEDISFLGQDITVIESARTLNNYRFYYEYIAPCGGTGTYFAGWSEQSNGIFGADWDVPLKDFVSIKTGFTYLGPGRNTVAFDSGGDGQDSWNLYTGCVYRPRGRGWYRCYDKPLFNVADNGSMIQTRDITIKP